MLDFSLSLLAYLSPLLIASSGALAAELSGRTNMGLEGQILIGAFAAALALSAGSGPLAACALGLAAAAAAAAALCAAMDRFGTDPIMAGLSFNLVAQSAAAALAKVRFGSQGTMRLPPIPWRQGMGSWSALSDAVIALLAFVAAWGFLAASRAGLRIRAVGSNEEAAATSGIRPGASRALAFALSGSACGLSGAILVLRLSAWSPGMTFGKGWLALAAMYLGRRRFPGLALSCLAFSVAQTASNLLQGQSSLPQEWSLAFPYAATLALMALWRTEGAKRKKRL